jgi:hypothetical protein
MHWKRTERDPYLPHPLAGHSGVSPTQNPSIIRPLYEYEHKMLTSVCLRSVWTKFGENEGPGDERLSVSVLIVPFYLCFS